MYKKAKWEYGNTIEIKKYHTFNYPMKGMSRRKRGESKEQNEKIRERQQRHNEREAVKKLERALVANFTENDFHCTLTYKIAPGMEEAKRVMRNFLQRLRRFYTKKGAELKFVAVTEFESKRIHHHLICNGIDGENMSREIHRIWGNGGTHLTSLYENCEYGGLAEYLVKETSRTLKSGAVKQRYTCSRNLIQPIPEIKTIKAQHWSSDITVPKSLEEKGYYLDRDSIRVYDDWAGYPNVEYKFIRPTRQLLKMERKRMQQMDYELGRFIKKGNLKREAKEYEWRGI